MQNLDFVDHFCKKVPKVRTSPKLPKVLVRSLGRLASMNTQKCFSKPKKVTKTPHPSFKIITTFGNIPTNR